jgi:tellurite resistance protein
MTHTIGHHQALIYVMVTIAAVDRQISDSELERIGYIVSHLPVFRDFDPGRIVHVSKECGEILSEDDGLETVLALVADGLPKKLYETAYALAVEVAAVDLSVEQEELRFLQLLRDALKLDKLIVAAIERGARARHAIA